MQHRHLVDNIGWTKAAIDSVLERGDLADWRQLIAAAHADRALAQAVVEVARQHPMRGVLPIVEHLLARRFPDIVRSNR